MACAVFGELIGELIGEHCCNSYSVISCKFANLEYHGSIKTGVPFAI